MINVAVYSAQPVLVAGLAGVFALEDDLSLAGASSSVAELVGAAATRPDLLLVEVTPEITLEALHRIRRAVSVPIALWVDVVAVEFVSQVISLGIRGILRKSLPVADLVDGLRRVATGELLVEKSLCDRLLGAKRVALTPRERQLLAALTQGLKNKDIGFSLGISEGTVKVYLSRLFQKVGANDRFDLALFALKNLAASHQVFDCPVTAERSNTVSPAPVRLEFLPNFVAFDRQIQ